MKYSLQTRCIHLEQEQKEADTEHYGAVSFPIYQTATYAHPKLGESTGYDYSRLQNPTRSHLEQVVAKLEYGIDAFALSSGMAAITLLMELFQPGDHFLVEGDLYGGSIRLFNHVNQKNQYQFSYLNFEQDDIEANIQENTKAIYIETPTNPMMHVSDIEKIAKIAKKHNLLFIVDNTFLSPYFQNPLLLGADVVIHSGTKFLGGHNDTLAGFIVTNREDVQERLRFLIKTTGAGLAPFDSWLLLRGIKTLALRMEQAQKNAQEIAEWLAQQKEVKRVIYPGLKSFPQHALMKKQARGFGTMLTFEMGNAEQARVILDHISLIKFAESLGGVETLMTYPTTQTHADVPEEVRLKNGITSATLRLSTGIENVKDLLADLEQAFSNFK